MSAIRFGPLDHCSILITDLAKAREFYVGVLGLKEIAKPSTFDFVVIWFDLGGGQTLHLLQKPKPDTTSPRHFALTVADAKAAREHIRAAWHRHRGDDPHPPLRPLFRSRSRWQPDRTHSMA